MRDTYTPCYDKNIGSLNVCLTSAQRDQLQSIINQVSSIRATGDQVITLLDNQVYFNALYQMLSFLETPATQTYHDGQCNLTIGIGFNLDQEGAKDIIQAIGLHPDDIYVKDEDPLCEDGWQDLKPDDGLDDKYISKLFEYTMKGYTPKSGEPWVGKAKMLQIQLRQYGLLDIQFTGYQLLALQSLVYNSADVLGKHLCAAIKNMVDDPKHDPLETAIEFIECSNARDQDDRTGIENRRLQEASVFFGRTDLLTVPMRQQSELGLTPIENSEPLPIQGYSALFTGGSEVITLKDSSCYSVAADPDPTAEANTSLGSNQPDRIVSDGPASSVILGGNGNDQLIATSRSSGRPILVGGNGDDYLATDSSKTSVLIGGPGNDSYEFFGLNTGIFPSLIFDDGGRIIHRGGVLQGRITCVASVECYKKLNDRYYRFWSYPSAFTVGEYVQQDHPIVSEEAKATGAVSTFVTTNSNLRSFGISAQYIDKQFYTLPRNLPSVIFTRDEKILSFQQIVNVTSHEVLHLNMTSCKLTGDVINSKIIDVTHCDHMPINADKYNCGMEMIYALPNEIDYDLYTRRDLRAYRFDSNKGEYIEILAVISLFKNDILLIECDYYKEIIYTVPCQKTSGALLELAYACVSTPRSLPKICENAEVVPYDNGYTKILDATYNFQMNDINIVVHSGNFSTPGYRTMEMQYFYVDHLADIPQPNMLLYSVMSTMIPPTYTTQGDLLVGGNAWWPQYAVYVMRIHVGDTPLATSQINFSSPSENVVNEGRLVANQEDNFFDCELDDQYDRYDSLETRQVKIVSETDSEGLLRKFLQYPCRFANWCLDKFVEGALHIAYEAVEAGGPGYGRQKSVYEACSGVAMFNRTHVYHPQLEAPCSASPQYLMP